MAVIIQKPDTLSMSGNMKKFIVSSGTQVSFKLMEGETVLLDASYEPGLDGRVAIDLKDVCESRLGFQLSHVNFYEQENIVKTFTALVNSTSVTFRVIRTGVANLEDTPSNWLRTNFLTWQPTNKKVTYHSPEWLTYYSQQACNLMVKAYFPDDTVQNINLGACEAGKAFTFNLQYAHIAGLLGQKYPTHFDAWIESDAGVVLTYTQRYLYSEVYSEMEQWLVFENSLGGVDTLRAYGDTDFAAEHSHKIATTDDISSEYHVDTSRSYQKNTGYLDEYERRWLLDFFPAPKKYIYFNSALHAIVVSQSDVKYQASDLPSSYSFTYRFARDTKALLNLVRKENEMPAHITLPNLESPDFHLPPRLVEFPRAQLHEGVIFPVFDPNSDQAQITTFGRLVERVVQDVSIAVRDKRLSIRFEFSNGNAFANIPFETVVTVHVFRGYDEITASIPTANWNWTRTTTDHIDDSGWNIAHKNVTSVLTLRINDQENDFGNNIYKDRQCVFTVTVLVPDTGEKITEQIKYAPY